MARKAQKVDSMTEENKEVVDTDDEPTPDGHIGVEPGGPVKTEEEVVEEEPAEDISDEPLTSEYIKNSVVGLSDDARNAVIRLYEDARNVWVSPVNNGIRSRFNKARRFLSELGGE